MFIKFFAQSNIELIKAELALTFIPADSNTTVDNPYMTGEKTYHYYNEMMWNDWYGICELLEDVIDLMKEE